ncbi:MAG: NUDIX hydrolase [Minisyncoccia bacterium]
MKLPTVSANTIVRSWDGRLVIVKHKQKAYDIRLECPWGLPGGGLEDGETPIENAIRETRQEIGVDIKAPKLIGTFIQRVRDDEAPGGFVSGVLHLFVSIESDLEGRIRWEGCDEIEEIALLAPKSICEKRQEIGLGYFRMILKYMRCIDGADRYGFQNLRLSLPVEYPRFGLKDKDQLVLQT